MFATAPPPGVSIPALFDFRADLSSVQIDDGHVVAINGRGFAEFVNEAHQPGVRPPSLERQVYDELTDIIGAHPERFVRRSLTFARDGRFPARIHSYESPSRD